MLKKCSLEQISEENCFIVFSPTISPHNFEPPGTTVWSPRQRAQTPQSSRSSKGTGKTCPSVFFWLICLIVSYMVFSKYLAFCRGLAWGSKLLWSWHWHPQWPQKRRVSQSWKYEGTCSVGKVIYCSLLGILLQFLFLGLCVIWFFRFFLLSLWLLVFFLLIFFPFLFRFLSLLVHHGHGYSLYID